MYYSKMIMPQYKVKTHNVAKNKRNFVYAEYKF